ncbi:MULTISPECIES: transcription termination/antitermination protein NusG [Ruminococcus]|uniref:Transcription termination/antitermination protein NusG n=1 Tax=Ruminococcus difficilis TaxID=2763069 RepID=A0A934WQC0_9FIRM|nr:MULTISPECIES: transcription termination/antitermination protein NusG [Ruminococcus]MBK6087428.1 transcription termination/antitermination protein NusG [Ruminococcus difficilis]MEE3491736.1 transcription termination/antitermination protein NusG [Ruminococcus sp.]
MSEDAKWYVIHTYSGYENKVASTLQTTVENRGLQDMIPDVKVPTEIVTEIKDDGSSKEVERKLFPGYVFVKMVYTDETWYVVRNIRGCTGFVGPSSKPVPLTESEVYKMGVESRVVEVSYDVGDQVRIIDGPLEDFVGIVDELDTDKNYVKVTISMFGRETPVELELNQAEKLED